MKGFWKCCLRLCPPKRINRATQTEVVAELDPPSVVKIVVDPVPATTDPEVVVSVPSAPPDPSEQEDGFELVRAN